MGSLIRDSSYSWKLRTETGDWGSQDADGKWGAKTQKVGGKDLEELVGEWPEPRPPTLQCPSLW